MSAEKGTVTKTLDVTQLGTLPDEELQRIGLTLDEISTLRGLPPTQLSSMIPLVVAAGKKKAKEIVELLPFDPEIDVNGNRRCVFVDPHGVRCERYGDKDMPLCKQHRKKAASLGTYFSSPRLRETFEAFATSSNKLQADGELALMRTMLASLLRQVRDDSINLEIIGAVTAMSEKITVVIERISKMSQLTPEHLQRLMSKMVEIAGEYVAPDKLEEFAKRVEQIELDDLPPTLTSPLMPDDNIQPVAYKDPSVRSVPSVQQCALVDVAARMGVLTDAK
jgi:hypothetical protein